MPGNRKGGNIFKVNDEILKELVGRWKITATEITSSSGTDLHTDDNLIEFTLDDGYDIDWHVPVAMETNQLFQTSSFQIDDRKITFTGTTDGTTFVFNVTFLDDCIVQLKSSDDTISIYIKKIVSSPESVQVFDLLNALKENYFSDLTIRSSGGSKFDVHRCVLNSSVQGVKYRDWEVLLSKLSSDAFLGALHYIYSSILPSGMAVESVKELLELSSSNSKLSHLHSLCEECIDSTNLNKRLTDLVDSCLHSLEVVKGFVVSVNMEDPAKVVYTIKQIFKEVVTGVSRFILLSHLYTLNKKGMSKREKREILEYIQARLIVFIDGGRELLQLSISKWETLTDDQQTEISLYLIPNINQIWSDVNEYIKELNVSLNEPTDGAAAAEVPPALTLQQKLAAVVQLNTARTEMKRVKKLKKEFKKFVEVGDYRRLQFIDLSEEEKVEKIKRVIEEMTHDGQSIIGRLEDLKKKILIANALDWGSYKLGVSIATSYISWGLNRLCLYKDQLVPLLKRLSRLISSDEFNQTLIELRLADPLTLFDETPPIDPPTPLMPTGKKYNAVIPLVGGCLELLKTQEMSDMILIVQELTTPTDDHTHKPQNDEEGVVIHAHRVILSSRSEWFRSALQSGMMEDRNKKIIIKDIDVTLFGTFIEYLYGKPLEYETMNNNEIIELLAVADRYETSSLHVSCEKELIGRIDQSSVFSFLVVADQLSAARQLRFNALQFILDNPDVLIQEVDAYTDLPIELKSEVRQILSGTQQMSEFRRGPPKRDDDDDTHQAMYPSELGELIDITDTSYTGTTGAGEIESLLSEMRLVVGDEPTDERLRSLLMAADMDINRAVNFFFGVG